MTMKKNKAILLLTGALSLALIGVRVLQLFALNEQGIVAPVVFTILVYALLLGAWIFTLVTLRAKQSEARSLPALLDSIVGDMLLILGVALILETWNRLLPGGGFSLDLQNKLLCLFAPIAGIGLTATFVSRNFFRGRTAAFTAPIASIAILAYLITNTILLFVNTRTSVALTLNALTLVMLCTEVFFFKALAKEFLHCEDALSRTSLLRSALLLIVLIPAELVGQLLIRFGKVAETPVSPIRGSYMELLTDAVVLLVAVTVLLLTVRRRPALPEEETAVPTVEE